MASGAISNEQISASSEMNEDRAVNRARLHIQPSGSKEGSWVAGTEDANQWLQVDLGSVYIRVTRVATQGRSVYGNQWVKSYKLQYSYDGVNFHYYREHGKNVDKVE